MLKIRTLTTAVVAAALGAMILAAPSATAHDVGEPSAADLHSRNGAGAALASLRKDLAPYQDVNRALADGGYRLLGAEWFQADADQDLTTHDDRPTLFGRPFEGPMPGHDDAMPVHYDLHVWLYQTNPAGVFASWNPAVSC